MMRRVAKATKRERDTNVDSRYLVPKIGVPTAGTFRDLMQGSLNDSLPTGINNTISKGQDVGFLPTDFLFSLGHSFRPFDASGMQVLNAEKFPFYNNKFDCVKSSLGIGKWSKDGPTFKFREKYASTETEGFQLIEAPVAPALGIFSFGISTRREIDWINTFLDAVGKENETPEAVVLCGDYLSIAEFLHMPEHLMTSREINGCVPGRFISQPKLLLSPNAEPTETLGKLLSVLELNSGHETQKLSVRFTAGRQSLISSPVEQRADSIFSKAFKSSPQMGCKGSSLGYHLVMGNEGRRVCTLHGSVDDILSDLKGAIFSNNPEIAANRQLLQTKQIESLLAPSTGHRTFQEVMSLRIVHPSPNAVIACAAVLGGDVPYDAKNKAIYPNTYGVGGSIALAASCAIIIEIFETMKRLEAGQLIPCVSIRFREIH